jgi:hypothetical protein
MNQWHFFLTHSPAPLILSSRVYVLLHTNIKLGRYVVRHTAQKHRYSIEYDIGRTNNKNRDYCTVDFNVVPYIPVLIQYTTLMVGTY